MATYTAALLAQTAVPAWHEARRELPFVFAGSAAASGGGLGMLLAPVAEAGPTRRLSAVGAAAEFAGSWLIEHRPDVITEAYTTGRAHKIRRLAEILTVSGAVAVISAARSSPVAAAAGLSLLAGSAAALRHVHGWGRLH